MRYVNKLKVKPLLDYTRGNSNTSFVLYIETLNYNIIERNKEWI